MYLRVGGRSVLSVQLQGLQDLLLLDEVCGVQSHVLMEDLEVLTNSQQAHFKPSAPLGKRFRSAPSELAAHLFGCGVQTFVPLSSFCIHVQSGHDIHANQLTRRTEKNPHFLHSVMVSHQQFTGSDW